MMSGSSLSCLLFLLIVSYVFAEKSSSLSLLDRLRSSDPFVNVIVPGTNWTATDGTSIQAHAPGVLLDPKDGSYWWYGESSKTGSLSSHGVNCYHSLDLLNWDNYGMVINQAAINVPGHNGPYTIERPKVLYNSLSGSYVMWFHIDDNNYSIRRVGIAVSFIPQGPFSFVRSFQPDGFPSLDMSLYEDKINGTVMGAYFVRSVDNSYVGISSLSSDYLSTTGLVSIIPEAREGHAIFYYQSRYYMLTSHLTGWAPNDMEAFVTNKDTIIGAEWTSLGNPTGSSTSFDSQPAFVVPYTSQKTGQNYFIYMGDRWDAPNLLNATYIWLPIQIDNQTHKLTISWKDQWSLDNPFQVQQMKGIDYQ